MEEALPRTAVIVACFNDGATLPEALDSLREEEPLEIIVVDDGSDDPRTLAVLDRVERDGVRILRQANQGPAAARTAALHATSARYVTALDADDVQAPGSLAVLADTLDANPDLSAVWGDVQTFGEIEVAQPATPTLDPWLLTYLNDVPADALVRREALLEAGGWRLRGGYEDWDLWLALAGHGRRGMRVPVLTGYYRVRSSGRMQTQAVARHDALYAELRTRHAAVFARRRELRRRSGAPWWVKLLFPAVEALPGASSYTKYRLQNLIRHPGRLVRARLQRRRAGGA
ncbi:MAG: glycosyltransferase family A protein [Gaiellaceae bacterium]